MTVNENSSRSALSHRQGPSTDLKEITATFSQMRMSHDSIDDEMAPVDIFNPTPTLPPTAMYSLSPSPLSLLAPMHEGNFPARPSSI